MGRIDGVSIYEPLASFRRAASAEKCPRPTDDLVLLVKGMLGIHNSSTYGGDNAHEKPWIV